MVRGFPGLRGLELRTSRSFVGEGSRTEVLALGVWGSLTLIAWVSSGVAVLGVFCSLGLGGFGFRIIR